MYYFIYEINALLNTYKDAAGMWHEDRFRPLVTAAANLTMNLVMVQFWGIYGVLLSTVLSMLFVGMPWLLHNLFTVIFDEAFMKGYLLRVGKYVIVVFISCIVCLYVCSIPKLGDLATLMSRMIICCIVPNCVYLIAYHRSTEFRDCLQLIDKMTKNKLKLEKRLFR